MTIKDKNGNVFKLRGPNPLVKDSSEWDKSAVKLINHYGSQEIIIDDARNPIKEFKETVVDIADELNLYEGPEPSKAVSPTEFIDELAESPEEIIEEKDVPESVTIQVDEKIAKILKDRGIEFYCAPVIGQKLWKDELYGTSYTTNKYGTKFIFDAVIIASSDLEIQFWCVREIAKNSIILRKNQQGGERWWKIIEIEPKTGGFICKAIVSDLNPDFS